MSAIKEAVAAREVPFLVHFTRTKNLRSILEHGIVPREGIGNGDITAITNDELRLDGQLGASCFSIGFPNAKMLWKLRQENPGANWVILVVSRTILWDLMAKRPIFVPLHDGKRYVLERYVDFHWHAGFAKSQKQKSIRALHEMALRE